MSFVPYAVAAETFAATSPRSNLKAFKDMKRLLRDCPEARARYVFFAAPGFKSERQHLLERTSGTEVQRYGRSISSFRPLLLVVDLLVLGSPRNNGLSRVTERNSTSLLVCREDSNSSIRFGPISADQGIRWPIAWG